MMNPTRGKIMETGRLRSFLNQLGGCLEIGHIFLRRSQRDHFHDLKSVTTQLNAVTDLCRRVLGCCGALLRRVVYRKAYLVAHSSLPVPRDLDQ